MEIILIIIMLIMEPILLYEIGHTLQNWSDDFFSDNDMR